MRMSVIDLRICNFVVDACNLMFLSKLSQIINIAWRGDSYNNLIGKMTHYFMIIVLLIYSL